MWSGPMRSAMCPATGRTDCDGVANTTSAQPLDGFVHARRDRHPIRQHGVREVLEIASLALDQLDEFRPAGPEPNVVGAVDREAMGESRPPTPGSEHGDGGSRRGYA